MTAEAKIKWLKRWSTIRVIPLIPFALMMPRNRKKIVFGAWSGHTFSCSPKYLMGYFARRGGFQCVWIGERRLKAAVQAIPNVRFAPKGSLAALWHMLTAKYYVYNVCWWTDLMRVPRCGKSTLIYTTHGTPSKLKGVRQFNGHGRAIGAPSDNGWFARLETFMFGKEAWCSVTSRMGKTIQLSNFVGTLAEDRLICSGTPRFDYLIGHRDDVALRAELKRKYAAVLGVSPDLQWYLYVPTWRHDPKDCFSFETSVNCIRYQKVLEQQGACLIEKHHQLTMERLWPTGKIDRQICIVSKRQSHEIDIQELMLASDRLITDFSSIYYDYYVTGRPIIHFAYDFDRFMTQDMGFNYDIREFAGGMLAYTEEELLTLLSKGDAELLATHGPRIGEMLEFEKGKACEGYYDLISALSEGRNPQGENA